MLVRLYRRTGGRSCSIAQCRWNVNFCFSALAQEWHSLVETFDHLPYSHTEAKWLNVLEGRVGVAIEDFSIKGGTCIIDRYEISLLDQLASSGSHYFYKGS